MLRWYGTDGKRYGETLGEVGKVTKREVSGVRREKQSKLDCKLEKPDKPKQMTLSEFHPYYLDRRRRGDAGRGHLRGFPKLAPKTILEHDMALRYLIQHFGPKKVISKITTRTAVEFVDALEAGKLAAARRGRQSYKLGQQRVKALIRTSHGIMNWARHFDYIAVNPFAGFDSAALRTKPKHYVSLPDFEKLVRSAPSPGWTAQLTLCRLAGLRLNEARTLPWGGKREDSDGVEHWTGIDWDRKRICLVGTHKGKKSLRYREVPICPRLHQILLTAFDAATDGQHTVTGLSPNNLTRNAERIARAAGLAVWKKFFIALRSSCEQDWKMAGVAEPTYCVWIGHGPEVSRNHYVSPTESEFAAVSRTHLGHTSKFHRVEHDSTGRESAFPIPSRAKRA
jgi:hypothetical protein